MRRAKKRDIHKNNDDNISILSFIAQTFKFYCFNKKCYTIIVMRKDTNQVEIKGPPLGEFKKKKSCLSKTCLSGGCLIMIFFIGLLAFKFVFEPRKKELPELPKEFTESIPIYDEKNIH